MGELYVVYVNCINKAVTERKSKNKRHTTNHLSFMEQIILTLKKAIRSEEHKIKGSSFN